MSAATSRRDFLKLSAISTLALGGLAFRPAWPDGEPLQDLRIGRVATGKISIFQEPSFDSPRLGALYRDRLLALSEEIVSPHGPPHNPIWYRYGRGYAHSGYLQPVRRQLNPIPDQIPTQGQIAVLTVPFAATLRYSSANGWRPFYRLYYHSNHWMTDIISGPDGRPWAQITDERLHIHYYLPAGFLQPVTADRLTPLAPEVPRDEKRLAISLEAQTVTAFEAGEPVFQARISSGVPSRGPSPNGIPTETPRGRFLISRKMPVRHMGNGLATADPEAYELPGVPWVSYFVSTGVAFHGTYWHNNYGRPMSRGCINMQYEDAHWIYRWSTPESGPADRYVQGSGPVVDVA